jgi:hypothetical protein
MQDFASSIEVWLTWAFRVSWPGWRANMLVFVVAGDAQ